MTGKSKPERIFVFLILRNIDFQKLLLTFL